MSGGTFILVIRRFLILYTVSLLSTPKYALPLLVCVRSLECKQRVELVFQILDIFPLFPISRSGCSSLLYSDGMYILTSLSEPPPTQLTNPLCVL